MPSGQLRPDHHQPRRAAGLRPLRRPNYYWGYDSKPFRELLAKYNASTDAKARLKIVGDIQRRLADDQVNAWLFQLPQFAVARKPLKGLWSSSPIFANDLAALSW